MPKAVTFATVIINIPEGFMQAERNAQLRFGKFAIEITAALW